MESTKAPLISVITPNYNYGEFIGETIESVINQKYTNWEYIIVDDGSTDDSAQVIQKYIEMYPTKITLIRQKNMGQSNALNTALERTSGDIICWINSDDTFETETFSIVITSFIKSNADIVFGNVNIVDKKLNFIFKKRHLKFNYLCSVFNGFGNTLTSNAVFWKSYISKNISGFNEKYKSNMDGEFFSRLTKNKNVFHVKNALANFRRQEISIAGKNNPDWDRIVQKEQAVVQYNSYLNTYFSKLVPYKFSFVVKRFCRVNRLFFRILYLHFISAKIENYKYSKRRK